jgi:hypothetical protein
MPFNDSILLVDRKWNQMGKQPLKGMSYLDQRSRHSNTLAMSRLALKLTSMKVLKVRTSLSVEL